MSATSGHQTLCAAGNDARIYVQPFHWTEDLGGCGVFGIVEFVYLGGSELVAVPSAVRARRRAVPWVARAPRARTAHRRAGARAPRSLRARPGSPTRIEIEFYLASWMVYLRSPATRLSLLWWRRSHHWMAECRLPKLDTRIPLT